MDIDNSKYFVTLYCFNLSYLLLCNYHTELHGTETLQDGGQAELHRNLQTIKIKIFI